MKGTVKVVFTRCCHKISHSQSGSLGPHCASVMRDK